MSKQHIIHFTGPINSSTCGNLINTCAKVLQQEAEELRINIATMGGECSYGFTLYNFLRALPVPIHTHNLGTVESMGNILFLAGERRSASAHSKFLFHPFPLDPAWRGGPCADGGICDEPRLRPGALRPDRRREHP